MSTDHRTPVAANTRSNNPTLVTETPLPQRTLMQRGNSGETDKNTEPPQIVDNVDPPPVNPPPVNPATANQAETNSDSSDKDLIMSTTTETDYLKYLASEYKTFKDNPNLSDVITLERELGTALWNIPNKYKIGGWSHVVDDTATHKIHLGITDGTYTAPAAPTLPDPGDENLS